MEIRTLEKIINFDISKKAALCTQVDWSGSVPRKDYPMMLVDEKGGIIGTIGGGDLEHSVINISKTVIKKAVPLIKTFDLTNEDVTKSASICGGKTSILIELYTKDIHNIFKSILINDTINNNIIITKVSTKNIIQIERIKLTKDYSLTFPQKIVSIINSAIELKTSKSINDKDEIFLIQNIGNRPILHIFGAGHVGKAVADLAQFIELDTKIYDERKDLANSARFPFALQINNIKISNIKSINIASRDYVSVATRGHKYDFELMKWLLSLDIDYVGLMSSKKKWHLLSEALVKSGFTVEQLSKVHSPVGLDVGSETVPEIAVSIISEIVNHCRNGEKSKISLSKV